MTIAAASSTWYWQNPLPRDYSVAAISCSMVSACVGVGAGGLIVTTADAGRHWAERGSGTSTDLQAVTCPSKNTCYASGFVWGAPSQPTHPVFLRSSDGGKRWRVESLIGPRSSLACPGLTTCLASAAPAASPTAPLRTTDGGKRWRAVHSPIREGIGGIICATRTVCYGVNGITGAVARSMDAGKTWHVRATVPKPRIEILHAIACPRANTCVATSSYCCDEGEQGSIFLSRDGAKTWRRVDRLSTTSISGVTCPSLARCYVSGDNDVIVTTNGGRTWSKRSVPDTIGPITCPGPTTCYAPAGVVVLKTGDGFKHANESLARSMLHSVFLDTINCPSATTCFTTTNGQQGPGQSVLVATVNGGNTWSEKRKPPGLFSRLTCPTPTVCFGILASPGSVGALYRSGDGGTSWQKLSPPAGSLGPRDVSCVTATSCYAISTLNSGKSQLAIWITHNAGKAWEVSSAIDSAARAALRGSEDTIESGSVSCPSASACFVTASAIRFGTTPADRNKERILVLSSGDGGHSWAAHQPAASWSVADTGDPPMLACPTQRDCYVVQYNFYTTPKNTPATVLVTHDGGTSWLRGTVAAGTVVQDIACPSAKSCTVVSTTGMYSTTDGGVSWQRQHLANGKQFPPLQGIACPSLSACYAVGGEDILATRPPK